MCWRSEGPAEDVWGGLISTPVMMMSLSLDLGKGFCLVELEAEVRAVVGDVMTDTAVAPLVVRGG